MGNEAAVQQTVGCYDLKGPDFETLLIGPVTATIIDADRQVRNEWQNGFPNWPMYRCALAGDTVLRPRLREWIVAFGVATAEVRLRKGKPDKDEIGVLAGWDAYYRLMNPGKWLIASDDVSDLAAVDPKTYRKIRDRVSESVTASMWEYWSRMQIAMRQVAMRERWVDNSAPIDRYDYGRGFNGDLLGVAGTGNYISPRRGSGC